MDGPDFLKLTQYSTPELSIPGTGSALAKAAQEIALKMGNTGKAGFGGYAG